MSECKVPGLYTPRTIDNDVKKALLDILEQKEVQRPLENPDDVTPHRNKSNGTCEAQAGREGNTWLYPKRLRKAPTQCTIHVLKRIRDDDEQTTGQAMKGIDADQ